MCSPSAPLPIPSGPASSTACDGFTMNCSTAWRVVSCRMRLAGIADGSGMQLLLELRRQRRGKGAAFVGRQCYFQAEGMQEQAVAILAGAVQRVAHDGVPNLRQVHAQLVGTPGLWPQLQH